MSRSTTVLKSAYKKLAAIERRVVAERDKLRELEGAIEELRESCETAVDELRRAGEAIEEAADLLSATV